MHTDSSVIFLQCIKVMFFFLQNRSGWRIRPVPISFMYEVPNFFSDISAEELDGSKK